MGPHKPHELKYARVVSFAGVFFGAQSTVVGAAESGEEGGRAWELEHDAPWDGRGTSSRTRSVFFCSATCLQYRIRRCFMLPQVAVRIVLGLSPQTRDVSSCVFMSDAKEKWEYFASILTPTLPVGYNRSLRKKMHYGRRRVRLTRL